MNIRPISEWTFYKHRFFIAYSSLAVLIGLLLVLYPGHIPPGISAGEQQSVVTSHAISFTQLPTPSQVVDLPYHAIQKESVQLLGLTPFGVRLPSLIFAALTALSLSLIIKRWFKANVGVVAIAIVATSTWFLSLGRLGTPDIMIPFWTSLLILCATYVSQQTKRWHIWKALFGLSAALSLYTPYMAYLFIATMIAAIAQPHLRYLIRQSSKVGLTIGVFFFMVLLAPLGWGIYNDPSILRSIFAIPASLPEPLQFGRDLLQAGSNLVNPFNISASQIITPLVSVTTAVLVVIGGFRLLGDFHSVRAYVLLIWMALLIPIIGFNPNNLTVLFVPITMVMVIGLNVVMRYWYKLFPLNPYARVFGLVPLFVLVFAIVQFNYQRYTYSMLYSPQAGEVFVPDAFIAQTEANKLPATTHITLVIPQKLQALYKVIADRRPNTSLITDANAVNEAGEYIVNPTENVKTSAMFGLPSKLLVDDRTNNAVRFVIYQR
jgi:4-amino-4-deoxy-L-arabinose transferase-like glycosyltransferase